MTDAPAKEKEKEEILFTPKIQELTGKLFELVPAGIILITPGEREIRPLSSTGDPGRLSAKGRDQCRALRDRQWFAATAHSLRVIVTASNVCAHESAQHIVMPSNRAIRTIDYRALPSLWPLSGAGTGPLAVTHEHIEHALEELIGVAQKDAELISKHALVVVTQMGVEPTKGPELPTAIIASLGFAGKARYLKKRPLHPCQGVLITRELTEVVW